MAESAATLQAEIERLRQAVYKHYAQKADDLCWRDDNELYAAFGLPKRDNSVGDPVAMLANCRRFIEQRCNAGGPWKSYAELEAENAKLRAALWPSGSAVEEFAKANEPNPPPNARYEHLGVSPLEYWQMCPVNGGSWKWIPNRVVCLREMRHAAKKELG